MTYSEFQQYCARFGFIETPMTEAQFNRCVAEGLSDKAIYGVGCDLNSNIDFDEAIRYGKEEDKLI